MKKTVLPCLVLCTTLTGCIQLNENVENQTPEDELHQELISPEDQHDTPEETPEEKEGNSEENPDENTEETEDFPPEEEVSEEIEPLPVNLVYPVTVEASTTFPDQEHVTFHPEVTLDGDTYYAWIEDAEGSGSGEWLEYTFDGPQMIQEIQVYNGYGRNFNENGYMTKMILTFSNGNQHYYPVEPHWNCIILPEPIETTSVRITILDTIENDNTAISEVVFQDRSGSPVTPELAEEDRIYIPSYSDLLRSLRVAGSAENLSPEQAAAFTDFIEETAATEVWLFSGGNGIPVLYLRVGNVDETESPYTSGTVIIYQWNGTQGVPYLLPQGDDVPFVVKGLLEQQGNYYIDVGTSFVGISPSWESRVLLGFHNGMVVEKPASSYFNMRHFKDTPQEMIATAMAHPYLKYMGFTTNLSRFEDNMENNTLFHILNGTWGDDTYVFGNWDNYNKVIDEGTGVYMSEFTTPVPILSTLETLKLLAESE